jgi:HSP20 family protein
MAADLIHLMHSTFLHASQAAEDLAWRPAVDVYRTPNGWLIKLELAGVRPEDIEVRVKGSRLTVRGARRDWCVGETCSCHMMEITYSHFERSVDLPEIVSPAQVRAEHRHGMLLIRIQREDNR